MDDMYGSESFNFYPQTFILPNERESMEKYMHQKRKRMILKPPNWFNGMGIKLYEKFGELYQTFRR